MGKTTAKPNEGDRLEPKGSALWGRRGEVTNTMETGRKEMKKAKT